jgi:hypothetical protein
MYKSLVFWRHKLYSTLNYPFNCFKRFYFLIFLLKMLQNLKIMTTLASPQRVIIFGGSNAKRIVPFLLELAKGKGIIIEDRTVSGHSLKDLKNLPKNTEIREKDIIFILSGGNYVFEKHIKIRRHFGKVKRICLTSVSLTLYLQYRSYMKISRKS